MKTQLSRSYVTNEYKRMCPVSERFYISKVLWQTGCGDSHEAFLHLLLRELKNKTKKMLFPGHGVEKMEVVGGA